MATVTREERHRRQAADDGDPDDIVHHAVSGNSTNKGYHDDPDCQQLSTSTTIVTCTRAAAMDKQRYPCQVCVLDGPRDGGRRGPSPADILQREDIQSPSDYHSVKADLPEPADERPGKATLYERYWGDLDSQADIAADHGVGEKSIGRWMREHGIPRRPQSWAASHDTRPYRHYYDDDESVPESRGGGA